MSERYGALPLGLYVPDLRRLFNNTRSLSTRELDFVFLRRAHGGPWAPSEDSLYASIDPSSPRIDPPAPFLLVSVRRTVAYATYRFLAPIPTSVEASKLRRMFGDRNADISAQG